MGIRGQIRFFACVLMPVVLAARMPTFRWHWTLECGIMLAAIFLFTSRSIGELAALTCIIVYISWLLSTAIDESNPMNKPITATSFNEAPLPKVLQYLAKQKCDLPIWDFRIYGTKLTKTNVSVVFSSGCTLADALDEIKKSAGCEYKLLWRKGCGNESSPTFATFQIWPAGKAEPTRFFGSDSHIDQDHIFTYHDEME